MKIGIILYSQTGHTQAVAERLEENLTKTGNHAEVVPLEPIGQVNLSAEKTPLKSIPPVNAYDTIILAAPVIGGRPASPIAAFLDGTPSLKGKKVAFLATHFFPYGWGCKQTFNSLKGICESKGAQVMGQGDVCWMSFRRGQQINRAVEDLSYLS